MMRKKVLGIPVSLIMLGGVVYLVSNRNSTIDRSAGVGGFGQFSGMYP